MYGRACACRSASPPPPPFPPSRSVCGHVRSDGDRLVGSHDDEIGSFVVAKPGGTTGKFEVEVVGLCRKHTPAWLRARQVRSQCLGLLRVPARVVKVTPGVVAGAQASGVGIRDEDFHLITREVVLNTLQSEMI